VLSNLFEKFEAFISEYVTLIGNSSLLKTKFDVEFNNTRQNREVCESYRLDHAEEKNFDYRIDEKINKVICSFICNYINIENPNAERVQIFEDGEPIHSSTH
jgi:hypothetical protein